MKNRIYQIFKECFPELPVDEKYFYSLFQYDECSILCKYVLNELAGFAAIRGNRIILLCVAPEYRHQGLGRQLVEESENLISKNGYPTVILGGTDSKLFLGAPTGETEWYNKKNHFFEKCGYSADHGCLEMIMSLQDFNLDQQNIPISLPGITYEYWGKEDKAELLDAVKEVDEDWVQYFQQNGSFYVAMDQGKCVGFTILSFNDDTLYSNGTNIVGNVGCVGVIPSRRKNGVGLAMVAHATNELKKHGCDISYIHYTYLDQWYGKLGYKPFLWYWFGYKHLN